MKIVFPSQKWSLKTILETVYNTDQKQRKKKLKRKSYSNIKSSFICNIKNQKQSSYQQEKDTAAYQWNTENKKEQTSYWLMQQYDESYGHYTEY